jgi:2,4-dienoyl-CoA reductase-like NADH-dependent reductase (Old Yellow Enzyme family)
MPDGVTNEEMKQFVKMAANEGINCVNISQGCYENPGAFAPDGEGEMAEWGPGFKKASGGLPVIAPNFMTPEAAEAALKAGKADIIALGRQAIADPFWPAKVKSGRIKDLVKCARCNTCYMNLFEHQKLRCLMNPTAGFEKYIPEMWRPHATSLKSKVQKFLDKAEGLPEI